MTARPGTGAALEALPDLVRDTPPGDRRRAGEVSEALRGVLALLPPGLVDELLAEVRLADAEWREQPRPAAADRLAGLVEDLAVAVDAHGTPSVSSTPPGTTGGEGMPSF